ncbi:MULTISPECIES: hypothetical protein [Nostocales]|uniref:Uncharacterized protein n=3 Tax=Nostocales TaxID=1161 RepID=A0A0C1MWD6_9CYAN|nr:hypothetical protein [Tolypothrix bouteillei]KAF3890081.1 hypothetical protein DA73_0400034965 [Tolypothrix bouteillei VB521301]
MSLAVGFLTRKSLTNLVGCEFLALAINLVLASLIPKKLAYNGILAGAGFLSGVGGILGTFSIFSVFGLPFFLINLSTSVFCYIFARNLIDFHIKNKVNFLEDKHDKLGRTFISVLLGLEIFISFTLLKSMFNSLIVGAFMILVLSLPISTIFLLRISFFKIPQDKIIVLCGMLNGIWLISTTQVEMGTLDATKALFFSFIIMSWSIASSTALLLQNFQYKYGKLQTRLATTVTAVLGMVAGIIPYFVWQGY